jgi:ATP-dependent RNA helicase DOB1
VTLCDGVTAFEIVLKISTMNSNDLFSFLDEVPAENEDENEQDAMQTDSVPAQNKTTQKRKADSPIRVEQNGDAVMHDFDEPGPSVHKRPRIASPKPIVLDDFETEAKREVAVSAGLTGSVDLGTRLELKHQVRSHLAVQRLSLRKMLGSASSCCTTRLQLPSHI